MPDLPDLKNATFIVDHSLVVQFVMEKESLEEDWEGHGHRECWILALSSLSLFLIKEICGPEKGAALYTNEFFYLN